MKRISGDQASSTISTSSWRMAWIEYLTCIWALLFAVVHIYWVMGGTAGLVVPAGKTTVLAAGGPLLAIDIAAIPLCIIAGVIALALVQTWSRIIPRWIWLTTAWGAGVVLSLRALVGLIQDAIDIISHGTLDPMYAYDLWFLIGGLLFIVIAWRAGRR
ncbi:DUF3995 domain-containing protein [Ktedonosporobacter rubrisoli]|uniref:DUF3995 domain-containing protein n=1 Tax=Ktedonosporobacter rubrisoli TaxID=2509675 RepID=A0A4P6JNQ4_KTERU|nr:DUF3995 domain-containing protein [Ktedonosporobacter rubrisoli]QBD76750.1 DUF3995 domain-containing protein [Ktedonosporobacter rubrisoli]